MSDAKKLIEQVSEGLARGDLVGRLKQIETYVKSIDAEITRAFRSMDPNDEKLYDILAALRSRNDQTAYGAETALNYVVRNYGP